ncbi:hypothetical protein EBZ39_00150 [bacterium]|nr:hypothetical protein [bacterium]
MAQLAVVDDGLILSLMNDTEFAASIPCLYNKREIFRSAAGGCGACARKRQDRQRKEMATIKMCLAGMSTEKKNALKKKLNAEQVRIMYVNAAGQVVQLTF